MAKVRPVRDIGDLLTCDICREEPASPIYNCTNGHIVCGICVDKVKKCATCETCLHVDFVAERLSQQFDLKFPCRHKHSGCDEIIAGTEMKTHQKNCYFRDIICTEWKTRPCGMTKLPMSEYVGHLQEYHANRVGSSKNSTITLDENNFFAGVGLSFHIRILENHDGNTFLLLGHISAGSLYFWMTVLGNAELAEKYTFEFKLYTVMHTGKKVEASWTGMPVVAFHDRPRFKEGASFYVAIPVKMVTEFGTLVEKEDKQDEVKIRFATSYRII